MRTRRCIFLLAHSYSSRTHGSPFDKLGVDDGDNAPMAQLVEQLTLNQWVPGSSPGGCTKTRGPA